MIEEVDAADGVREEVEDGEGDEAVVEAVAVVEGSELFAGGGGGVRVVVVGAGVGVQRGDAEEACEALASDFGRWVVVDVGLVVGEEGEFLFREGGGLKSGGEGVSWEYGWVGVGGFRGVDGCEEVERGFFFL